ncbi:integrase core domain-containing protein [Thiocapsa imhoffii]
MLTNTDRLDLIEDLFSRTTVGWEVPAEESAEHASRLIERACLAEGVHRPGLVLHSDYASPMTGATMLSTLQRRLGVVPSFSRPSVSDDNPDAESLFRTLKDTPAFPPQPFASLADARAWVARFVHWYNEEHRHSKIRFVTHGQRHRGKDIANLAHRHQVDQDAHRANPTRWSRQTRNWTPIDHVWLTQPAEGACAHSRSAGRPGRMKKRTTMLTNTVTQVSASLSRMRSLKSNRSLALCTGFRSNHPYE